MRQPATQRGQTLPIVAIAILVLLGAAGFAADAGYHQYEQRVQQSATDSAALAGAAELAAGNYAAAARRDAATNGFIDGTNDVAVIPIAPPGTPDAYASDIHAVQVQITARYPAFFERVFGIDSVNVTTKAVAISDARSNLCVLALQTGGTSSINAQSVINAPNCSIAINNSHLSIGGQSSITTATPIQYSGSLTGAGTSTFSPGVPVSAIPASDPCPQIASCAYLQANPPATAPCTDFHGSGTILPGAYCRMDFTGPTTFAPGLYVLSGSFNANNVTLSGTGVTIADMSANGAFSANNTTFQLSAPTSGAYSGMLWYAPNYTQPITFNAGDGGLSGVIYFPQANLTMNTGTNDLAVVVAGQMTLNAANTTFNPPPSAYVTYPRLVE